MIDKIVDGFAAALAGMKDGDTLLCGGFGSVGEAFALVEAVIQLDVRDLTVVCNNGGSGLVGVAALLKSGKARKLIASYPRSSDPQVIDDLYARRAIEIELVPQGTLSERMRAAGAGIGGFFTRAGADTKLADGKELREIDGKLYILEKPLPGDFALIKAHRADRWGNLVYRKSARNFNPVMAMAGKTTVAQVDEIAELGTLDPDAIMTPSIFVDRVVILRDAPYGRSSG
ncbi:MAG TPA: 3-oxoacid CoA-transferase subunit A [Stellaceae bacterium]|nr:3-oxoacid CoA-transferase subunit A [Stellaceae bacterium]